MVAARKMARWSDIFTNSREPKLSMFTFQVVLHKDGEPTHATWRIWKLIPVKIEQESLGSGFPPSYDGDATRQPSTHAQRTDSENDEFGTIVNEVTVVTTNSTVTTRKRYRAEDA